MYARLRPALAAALFLFSVGCAQREHAPANRSTSNEFTGALKIGRGVACSFLGRRGPASYAVRDIGKAGVPRVSAQDLHVLRVMMRYVHPSTLRFAYLQGAFSVFDATNGPCSGSPYTVLNNPSCNAIYVPFDATGEIGAATGCNMQPRPWIPHDRGNPHGLSWTDYE